ncbi:MAG TPA: hypothetical protein VGJ30_06895 [Candidatus Angelobacter sp.]|jgi:hypothetical protein
MRRSSTLKAFIRKHPAAVLVPLTAITFLLTVSCGGNSMMMSSTRQMQSITVTPMSADAMVSNGMVQFSAMGNFNMAPMSANIPVRWSLGSPFSGQPAPMGVSISANGLAQCSGFMGMITVQATAPMDPNMPLSQMSMSSMNVTGMAQLTCP